MGIPDHFVEHGERDELLAELGLDARGIADACRQLATRDSPTAGEVSHPRGLHGQISLHQFVDDGLRNQVLWPAGGVDDRHLARVNAEIVIERGKDLLKVDGPLAGFFAQAIGRADHLSATNAAAGQECTADIRPMIAPRLLVDPRRAAEFAPDDHRDVVEHARGRSESAINALKTLIELAAMVADQVEVPRMAVPATEGERHHAHAGFDQSRANSKCSLTVGAPSY